MCVRVYWFFNTNLTWYLFIGGVNKPIYATSARRFIRFLFEVLRPQNFYNIFTINYMWLIVIGLNLNLILRLFFCLKNNNQ